MDKQDSYYLTSLNEKLILDTEDKRVPEWFFELVIDRLEKEWFVLVFYGLSNTIAEEGNLKGQEARNHPSRGFYLFDLRRRGMREQQCDSVL
jgi:hypothetical protein